MKDYAVQGNVEMPSRLKTYLVPVVGVTLASTLLAITLIPGTNMTLSKSWENIISGFRAKSIVCEYVNRKPSEGDSIRRFINMNRGNTRKEIPTSSLMEKLIKLIP